MAGFPSSAPDLRPFSPPVALAFAAHDPTAGAGMPADLAVFASLGCQPVGVLTGLTAQDTTGVHRVEALSAEWVAQQAAVLMADIRPAVFKTGALCSAAVVSSVADAVRAHPGLPLVVDPVMASGRGDPLGSAGLREALLAELLPLGPIITPNLPEALLLSGQADAPSAAQWLLSRGASAVLLTGTHDESTGSKVVNTLYLRSGECVSHRCLRLPGHYHGSGCTLASSLAAFLALGQALQPSVEYALRYTWETLDRAKRPGAGQGIPDRHLGQCWTVSDFAGKA